MQSIGVIDVQKQPGSNNLIGHDSTNELMARFIMDVVGEEYE